MEPRALRDHKAAQKTMESIPEFRPLSKKNNQLPRPLDGLGRRKNAFATELISLSSSYRALFLYRDGEILTDKAFYGYLFACQEGGVLYPLYELHWHPSHKGLHCNLPCNTVLNYSGRLLVQAPELSLKMSRPYDPAQQGDREILIREFCRLCGVTLRPPPPIDQKELFQ